jgi:hypothetical protein
MLVQYYRYKLFPACRVFNTTCRKEKDIKNDSFLLAERLEPLTANVKVARVLRPNSESLTGR